MVQEEEDVRPFAKWWRMGQVLTVRHGETRQSVKEGMSRLKESELEKASSIFVRYKMQNTKMFVLDNFVKIKTEPVSICAACSQYQNTSRKTDQRSSPSVLSQKHDPILSRKSSVEFHSLNRVKTIF